jgi:hypothetical protein
VLVLIALLQADNDRLVASADVLAGEAARNEQRALAAEQQLADSKANAAQLAQTNAALQASVTVRLAFNLCARLS